MNCFSPLKSESFSSFFAFSEFDPGFSNLNLHFRMISTPLLYQLLCISLQIQTCLSEKTISRLSNMKTWKFCAQNNRIVLEVEIVSKPNFLDVIADSRFSVSFFDSVHSTSEEGITQRQRSRRLFYRTTEKWFH